MKKTWTLIALAAALCVSCSDDDKSCTEGAAFCKSGDNNTTVLVTCENGELNETVCNTGYICDSKKKMCTDAELRSSQQSHRLLLQQRRHLHRLRKRL